MLRRSNSSPRLVSLGLKKHWSTKLLLLLEVTLVVFVLFKGVAPTRFASAQINNNSALQVAQITGLPQGDIRTLVARIINGFLGLLGIIAVSLVIYAGYLYMTAGANGDQTKHALAILRDAVIGLVIIVSAYAIAKFVMDAIFGATQGGGAGTGGNETTFNVAPLGSNQLGNGILSSHYPNRDQTNVPRNTMISITFKQPLGLSTVLLNYDDKGTPEVSDDAVCVPDCSLPSNTRNPVTAATQMLLNTSNIKIIPQSAITTASGNADAQFSAQYVAALTNLATQTVAVARVTPTSSTFDPAEYQTITIVPSSPLGNATSPVNYRVALRGGPNGIQVWNKSGTQVRLGDALGALANGGYFWAFTTSTVIDLTPPKLISVVPSTVVDPTDTSRNPALARNQLLQMYFDEPIDPTTASGILGSGGGFTNILIQGKCVPGATCSGVSATSFETIPGRIIVGSNYQVAEFASSGSCDSIATNSCGDPITCLPANIDLAITARAASLGANPPQALVPSGGIFDGLTDMAGNSLDGNRSGVADGPNSSPARPIEFSLNNPPRLVAQVSDSVKWLYRVGNNIDLVPPKVTSIDPTSYGVTSPPDPRATDSYPDGPSQVPLTKDITATWDKPLSIGSLRTGLFGDNSAAIALGANECAKNSSTPCVAGQTCPCTTIPAPAFSVSISQPNSNNSQDLVINHRPFVNINDLGFTPADDPVVLRTLVPTYVPKFGSKLRDTLQNCFNPSMGYACPVGSNSCCNRSGQATFNCPP